MSRKDTSLERVDIVKLLVFVLVFVLVCLVMIFGFILPNIKEYRSLNMQNRSATAAHAKVLKIYTDKMQAFEAEKQKHETTLKAYDTAFDKQKFINFASTFFQDVTMDDGEAKNQDEKFFRYQLNASISMKSPQSFYDFLDALEKYETIVKIEFPIVMKSEEQLIQMSFGLRVYGLK